MSIENSEKNEKEQNKLQILKKNFIFIKNKCFCAFFQQDVKFFIIFIFFTFNLLKANVAI